MRLGISRLIVFGRNGHNLVFFPSALSETFWLYPFERLTEERVLARLIRPGDICID